jgi:alpha-glucosidase
MSIVYYSPIEFLFWYDAPSDYHGEKELELWKQIPTVWDETYPICGEIGQYIALARRTDKTWYLGIMNGLETKTLRIPTAFLKKGHRYMATFYEDDPSHTTRTAVNTHTAIVRGGRSLTFKLLASGGASAVFSEIEK